MTCAIMSQLKNEGYPFQKREVNGRYAYNIGHYCIGSAYGGWKLSRICSNGGGQRDISNGGYITKAALYDQIIGMLNILHEPRKIK